MERRAFLAGAAALLAAPLAAEAQPAQKIHRIGVLSSASRNTAEHAVKAFDEGLRELGYEEGRNAVIERRFADGQLERLPALAVELVRLKVDVIVTGSNPSIDAVKKATTTIPIVMGLSRDPVGAGFIASLSRPAGNITGLTNDPAPDMLGKNLELLKEAAPRVSRIAYLWNPLPSSAEAYRSAAESAARKLGVRLQSIAARRGRDLDDAFSSMARERADGLMVQVDPVFFSARSQLVLLAAKHRLPAVYGVREFAEVGGLMSYGTNIAYQFRRAATYVDKILKGAKPADLPVEQPTKFELVINMKTAKALGLTIPQSVLLRADQVIE